MIVNLHRAIINNDGAFGIIAIDNAPICVSVERTYFGGEGTFFTKIKPESYKCVKSYYHAGKYDTYEIIVPGYSRILFHKANKASELDGCIAPGTEFGEWGFVPVVLNSGVAFQKLMKCIGNRNEFTLNVQ